MLFRDEQMADIFQNVDESEDILNHGKKYRKKKQLLKKAFPRQSSLNRQQQQN